MLVTDIHSVEDEQIHLIKSINPLDQEKNPRGVEFWLKELEDSMKETL